ncbi:DUF4097 family beta strand repeat-containing protein [Streptomyces sp. NPDC097981]|uniref:DUF4097 family beta strand repeat-containing protein n=1 Tax=Streptomyces sp. NPDC097981 TaxID=3155428 RepID=UPI00332738D2
MHTFNTPAPIAAVLDVPAAHIRFIAADRADTVVEVRPANTSKSRDVKAAEQLQVTYDNGVLRIEAPAAKSSLLGNSGTTEITVQLPAGSTLDGKAADAELRGVGRLGDVTFEAARATVKLDESAAVRLSIQAGDVTLGRLTGPAQISTQQGDLTITEAAHGPIVLRAESGNIAVTAARGISATLDAGTAYGRVTNSLVNTGTAAVAIRATTSYGDITARSL